MFNPVFRRICSIFQTVRFSFSCLFLVILHCGQEWVWPFYCCSRASLTVVGLVVTALLPRSFSKEESCFVTAEWGHVKGNSGRSDSCVTENTQQETRSLTKGCSNSCVFPLNQEKAAVRSLVRLAAGYSTRFHPAALLKKQVKTRLCCAAATQRRGVPVPCCTG